MDTALIRHLIRKLTGEEIITLYKERIRIAEKKEFNLIEVKIRASIIDVIRKKHRYENNEILKYIEKRQVNRLTNIIDLRCEGYWLNKLNVVPMDKVAHAVCETKITRDLYEFASSIPPYSNIDVIDILAEEICKRRNLNSFSEYAQYTPEEDFYYIMYLMHRATYEERNGPRYIYDFANYIKGAPINKLADALCDAMFSDEYIYLFARYIEGAPIDKLADALIRKRNKEYIEKFIKDVKGAPVEKLTEALKNI